MEIERRGETNERKMQSSGAEANKREMKLSSGSFSLFPSLSLFLSIPLSLSLLLSISLFLSFSILPFLIFCLLFLYFSNSFSPPACTTATL